jgi:hypothetical protein
MRARDVVLRCDVQGLICAQSGVEARLVCILYLKISAEQSITKYLPKNSLTWAGTHESPRNMEGKH